MKPSMVNFNAHGNELRGSIRLLKKHFVRIKLTAILLATCLLNISATTTAQQVSFSGKNVPLETVFSSVKKQTGFVFVYTEAMMKIAKPVTISVKDQPVKVFLEQLFKGQPLGFEVRERVVIVSERVVNPEFNSGRGVSKISPAFVKIRVVDSVGKPLAGATVTVKGSKVTGVTDGEGVFSVEVDPGDVLLVSYIGYETRSVIVTPSMLSSTNNLIITLSPSITKLDEVKIEYSTGYQELNKDRATGSFVHVNNELLNRTVSTNILDRLRGVVSGLNFDPRSDGSSGSPIKIRGISTIHANNMPLIVVDNFPYDGDITQINPNDILSITVLKDAAAASIWGVRAGNGVIVITTKHGNFNRRLNIQFNSNVNIGGKPDLFYQPLISSQEVIDFQTQLFNTGMFNTYDDDYPAYNLYPVQPELIEILLAKRRGDLTQTEADNKIADLSQHDVRNDINRYLLQNRVDQQYALNFSGGSDKYKYYSSVGYDKNLSNNIRDEHSRLTFRMDNTYVPVKSLEINGFLIFTQNKSKDNALTYSSLMPDGYGKRSVYSSLADMQGNPLAIPKDNRLAYVDTASYPGLLDWHYIPLDELRYADNTNNSTDIRLGGGVKYNFTDELNFDVRYQYERLIGRGRRYHSDKTYFTRDMINKYAQSGSGTIAYPVPIAGIVDLANSVSDSWNLRGQLNYSKRWKQHQLVALAGIESREFSYSSSSYRRYGYDVNTNTFVPNINYTTQYTLNPGPYSGMDVIPAMGVSNEYLNRHLSYYTNDSYSFKNRYILTGSVRLDKSNFFGVKANQRQIPLWSTGVAWDIGKEEFYKVKVIPVLKLRVSYGYNGNTNNSATAYPTMTYSAGTNTLTPAQMARLVSPPNPQLRWERIEVVNLGVDFESKGKRIGGSFEYYLKKGLDLISDISVDPTTGVNSYVGNNANIKGSGFDLTVNTRNFDGKFKWYSNFLFSYTSDRVTAYEKQPVLASEIVGYGGVPIIGKPLYKIYSYRWGGLNPINGDPQGIVADAVAAWNIVSQGTNTKPEDLVYHGRTTPDIFGSFRNTFDFGNFSLSFSVLYEFGYFFRRNTINYYNFFNNWGGHGDYSIRWQKPGDELLTNVPSLPTSVNASRDQFYSTSEVLVEKGNHIRLQDIRLDYNLSRDVWKQLPVNSIQIYAYCANASLLWTANRKGIDPWYRGIPSSRTIAFGVNIHL